MTLEILLNIIISFTLSNTETTSSPSQPPTTPSPTPLPWISRIDGCSVYFPTIDTTFNVCNLKLRDGVGNIGPYYEVQDYRWNGINEFNETARYLYHFNIGAPILSEDVECSNITSNPGYCSNITSDGVCLSDLIPITGISYAYQLRVSNITTNTIDDCWRLSNEQGGPPQFSLVYPQNPTEGVRLSYKNGDFLHDGGCPDNRQFSISFLCENEFLNVPDTEPLYEKEKCEYTLELPSIYGCPVECKVYDRALCNNEGLCGYDFTNNRPRCFCYDKYIGDDCSIHEPDEIVTAPHKELPAPSPTNIIYTFPINDEDGNNILNVTYDLTPMGLNGKAYRIQDEDAINNNYTYYVGIFQNIDLTIAGLPESCANLTYNQLPCTDIDSNGDCHSFGNNGRDYFERSYAFQYDPDDDWCCWLGTAYEWSLYDEIDDPARGITINYKHGTWCGSRGINRAFDISLVCPDDSEEFTVPNINEEAFVEEDTEAYCEYTMEIKTAIACPYQCRTSKIVDGIIEYSVCSEHGICAADPNAGFVRCLCDDGWTGIECNEIPTMSPTKKPTLRPTQYPTLGVQVHNVTIVEMQEKPGNTGGFTVIIIILVVVLIIFCILGYYGFKKFKQREAVLQVQIDQYKVMGNDEEHDLRTDKKGITTFTTIDDHIAKDNDDED